MAGEATAMVTSAVRSVHEELHGPAGSRLWRPGFQACLIEKPQPVWVFSPVGFAAGQQPAHLVVTSQEDTNQPAIADVLVVMAGLMGGSDRLRELALHEGLYQRSGRVWWALPSVAMNRHSNEEESDSYPDLVCASSELRREAVSVMTGGSRMTVMAFQNSLVTLQQSVNWLRAEGIDVDEFVLKPSGVER